MKKLAKIRPAWYRLFFLPDKRQRGWLASAAIHFLVLLLLAGWTLTAPQEPVRSPWEGGFYRDIAPSGAIELAPVRVEASASDLAGAVVHDPLEVVPELPEPEHLVGELASLTDRSAATHVGGGDGPLEDVLGLFGGEGAAMEPSGQGGAEFFGVHAEGDQFVFVVDSSFSMSGRRWQDACRELLTALARLGPEQSFYVFFFDAVMHPMFGSDDQRLVAATDENLQRVEQWLHTIRLGYATQPLPAMQAAVQLQPDAVFLLSDGEFSDDTAEYLRRHNRTADYPDRSPPAVAVHTIGFHNRQAQAVLRRIAQENGGTYQFVPASRGTKGRVSGELR